MKSLFLFRILAAACGLLFLIDGTALAGQSQPPGGYQPLAIGDNLQLTVMEDATFDGCFIIRRGGYIIVPAVGRITLAGLTIPAAEAEVSKSLEGSQLEHATVEIKKVTDSQAAAARFVPPGLPDFILVTGRVSHPGVEPFMPGGRLGAYAAIEKAGGLGRSTDLGGVYVLRFSQDGTKSRIPVDVAAIRANRAPDVTLEKNDIVVVSR